ncbi:MAG TPA: RES family NAD+ phosphorylase [Balneolaceae bacterium]
MVAYRLAREKYINDLSGTGAKIHGGRWNQKGTSMLYTSEHCSLALLEFLVNISSTLLPRDIHLLKLSIPDDVSFNTVKRNDLPANWRHYPASENLAEIGSKWADSQNTVGLKVPSVLVPDEYNILLNPNHSSYEKIEIKSVSPFNLDSRFYR